MGLELNVNCDRVLKSLAALNSDIQIGLLFEFSVRSFYIAHDIFVLALLLKNKKDLHFGRAYTRKKG